LIYLFIKCQLKKHEYLMIRTFINSKISNKLLSSYDQILCAKQKSYPDNVIISESHAKDELQSLLDQTETLILLLTILMMNM